VRYGDRLDGIECHKHVATPTGTVSVAHSDGHGPGRIGEAVPQKVAISIADSGNVMSYLSYTQTLPVLLRIPLYLRTPVTGCRVMLWA
jgi:hypothetical protein